MLCILRLLVDKSILFKRGFSTQRTTPSRHFSPRAVPPFSTAFDAYSTWKIRPSGENVDDERSYPLPELAIVNCWVLAKLFYVVGMSSETSRCCYVPSRHMSYRSTFSLPASFQKKAMELFRRIFQSGHELAHSRFFPDFFESFSSLFQFQYRCLSSICIAIFSNLNMLYPDDADIHKHLIVVCFRHLYARIGSSYRESILVTSIEKVCRLVLQILQVQYCIFSIFKLPIGNMIMARIFYDTLLSFFPYLHSNILAG